MDSQAPVDLFVGNLDGSVTEKDLYEFLQPQCIGVRLVIDMATGLPKGFAYVQIRSAEDAQNVIEMKNMSKLGKKAIRIMPVEKDRTKRQEGVSNLFVKGLAKSVDERVLWDQFSKYGTLASIKISRDDAEESRCYGYVSFREEASAKKALAEMNGRELDGHKMMVSEYKKREARSLKGFTNIFIKNLPLSWNEANLKEYFNTGESTSIFVARDEAGVSKGFGFINFTTHDAAQRAVDNFNAKEVEGGAEKQLYVAEALSKERRRRTQLQQKQQKRVATIQKYRNCNLYVKPLEDSVTSASLKVMFEPFGSVHNACVATDPEGKSRHFGFVCMETAEEAERAKQALNGQTPTGATHALFVVDHRKKEERIRQQQNMFFQNQIYGTPYRGNFMGPMGPRRPPMNRMPRPQQRPPMMMGGMPRPSMPRGMAGPMQPTGQPMIGARPPFPGYPMAPWGARPQMAPFPPRGARPMMMQPGWMQPPFVGAAPGAPMPLMQQWMNPMQQFPQERPAQPQAETALAEKLAKSEDAAARRNILGDALYPKVQVLAGPEKAPKITGMLLELDEEELMSCIDSGELLNGKVMEALELLKNPAQ